MDIPKTTNATICALTMTRTSHARPTLSALIIITKTTAAMTLRATVPKLLATHLRLTTPTHQTSLLGARIGNAAELKEAFTELGNHGGN